jgi:acetyltransferase-like isoleucine patch superfamily enzyme
VGSSEVGKNSTIEEQICGERFTVLGDNCYIGVNSAFATHLVEGIFGNISYFKIRVGDNSTWSALNIIGPGTRMKHDSYLLPLASAAKHSRLRGERFYFGIPLRKASRRKIRKWTGLTKEIIEKAEKEIDR